ncbi:MULTISPECIES: D-aminoacyl-tRNA deacylase [Methylomonas]|uniref:D-aminoacyl-tRNA deacylase n=1 Tax=Methylomonas koyamae TaxID=702114 RepID=A0A177N0B1_9GAMM|nr:D-aminoacyl-tRNA deacylase [Methylomonas koyamae]OAI11332.1 D-tyrosyl-tRNA(Tyr) deacylase [Methylomonas koyamae]
MITVIQRVRHAEVVVDGIEIGRIGPGILALVGVEKPDTRKSADRLLERILSYRIFADAQGKMNLSLRDIGGGLLLVPQFTLAADTDSGNRPSFTAAAPPALGRDLFAYLQGRARDLHPGAQFGRFGADMQVSLTNDGPVTFTLRSADKSDR